MNTMIHPKERHIHTQNVQKHQVPTFSIHSTKYFHEIDFILYSQQSCKLLIIPLNF